MDSFFHAKKTRQEGFYVSQHKKTKELTMLGRFRQQGYFQGVFWIVLVAFTSNANDILMRMLGTGLPAMEVAFFRFFFATLTLLPIMLIKGPSSFYTKRPMLHGLRAVLLFGAIACWVTGLSMVHLMVASTMALTTNLFVLPMAYVFLGERVGWQRTIATLLGFSGIFIVLYESSTNQGMFVDLIQSGNGALYLLGATMMFALSDIVNKRFVSSESTLSMMFYIALGTSLIGFIPAYMVWVTPSLHQLGLLFLLGIGGNLILLFLLKAFAATDVSALSPYRYTELFSAGILGYLIFSETPSSWTLLAAAIIIPSTFWIAHYETRKSKY